MAALPPAMATAVISEFIKCGTEYLACKEREQTKRAKIAAELEAKLTAINKHYDICSRILADNHEYTMKVYDIAENLLNKPQIMENPAMLKEVLNLVSNAHSQTGNNLTTMFSSLSLR